MDVIAALCVGTWGTSFFMLTLGTLRGVWVLNRKKPSLDGDFPGITVIKPLKGVDPGMKENFEIFLNQNYKDYEILFSVASEDDPAVEVVREVLTGVSPQRARLIIQDVDIGYNPKVNNMITPYEESKYNWILISDGHIRVTPDYLRQLASTIDPDAGIVTAMIAGLGGVGFTGSLEVYHMSSYYTRALMIADSFGQTVALGGSLLFDKTLLNRIGGLQAVKDYMAEDYVMGVMMRKMGKKVRTMPYMIHQYNEQKSFRRYWQRHLRWGVTQKMGEPAVYAVLPIQFFPVNAGLAAIAAERLGYSPYLAIAVTMLVWALHDIVWVKLTKSSFHLGYWFVREFVAPAMWVHALFTQNVDWRGTKLRVLRRGLLAPRGERKSRRRESNDIQKSA